MWRAELGRTHQLARRTQSSHWVIFPAIGGHEGDSQLEKILVGDNVFLCLPTIVLMGLFSSCFYIQMYNVQVIGSLARLANFPELRCRVPGIGEGRVGSMWVNHVMVNGALVSFRVTSLSFVVREMWSSVSCILHGSGHSSVVKHILCRVVTNYLECFLGEPPVFWEQCRVLYL